MSYRWVGALVGLALLGAAGPADASLINDEVGCNITGGGTFTCSTATATVGAGSEFTIGIGGGSQFFDVDFMTSSVGFRTIVGSSFSLGFTIVNFTDLEWTDFPSGEIVGLSLSQSGVTGLSLSDLSFSPHGIVIDLIGTDWNVGSSFNINITTDHTIPEPSTLALFGIGLAGLGFMTRRRRNRRRQN